jgi:hypothetical protein
MLFVLFGLKFNTGFVLASTPANIGLRGAKASDALAPPVTKANWVMFNWHIKNSSSGYKKIIS